VKIFVTYFSVAKIYFRLLFLNQFVNIVKPNIDVFGLYMKNWIFI